MKKLLTLIFLILTSFNFVSAQSDTVSTPSGLKYIVIEKKDGVKAEEGKAVEVHYTCLLYTSDAADEL